MDKAQTHTTVITNLDYLPELLGLLSKAKKKIDILSYSFAIGSAGGKLNTDTAPYVVAKKLVQMKDKLGEKLTIRLYMEGSRDTADRNAVTGKFLEKAGIEVMYGAAHAKGFCVDGRFVLLGSSNLTHQSMTKNNEANVLLDHKPTATQFTRYFEHLWNGGGHGGIKLKAPLLADGDFKDAILESVGRAKKRIEFSIYFFNHREIQKALVEAFQRGVKVTGFIHQHAYFAFPYVRANRATVKRMRAEGLDDLHLSVPTTFSHSKYLIIDRKEVLIGTGNWLVEDVKEHPQLYLHLKDAEAAKKLVKHLSFQLKTQATED